jgi:hypothetical protein
VIESGFILINRQTPNDEIESGGEIRRDRSIEGIPVLQDVFYRVQPVRFENVNVKPLKS